MKMVTYFNKKDLVEFGNYLYSEEREKSFIHTSAQAAVDGIDLISSWDRLRTVTHADVCNFIELQRNKQRVTKSQPPKESNVPQWLQDHMATAPKELQNYVFKVFPQRLSDSTPIDSVGSFIWIGTPEGHYFWSFVNHQSWEYAIHELSEKNLL
jgi:RimJ/RimL family protein N-acetyltransferase